MRTLRYFSVFSGAGGFEIGIDRAVLRRRASRPRCGADGPSANGDRGDPGGASAIDAICLGFSETDPCAAAVLRHNFPGIDNYGDIARIDWRGVPDFDLLVGGSPCQDFSITGNRTGLEGRRSALVLEFVRALAEKRPAHFIWENVRGVLSSNRGWDFAAILHQMAAQGYSLWWQVLNARNFGVPQNRERVFVVGARADSGRSAGLFFEPAHDRATSRLRLATGDNGGRVRHDAHGIHAEHPEIHPDVARALDAHRGNGPVRAGVPDLHRIRRLTPLECERLMSWPDHWTQWGRDHRGRDIEMTDNQRYRMCGNGVVSNVVGEIVLRHIL